MSDAPDTAGTTAVVDGQGAPSSPSDGQGSDAGTAANGAAPATPPPDLSVIPEALREMFAPVAGNEAALRWLKTATGRRSEVEKERADLRAREAEIAKKEQAAAMWEDFASNPARIDALLEWERSGKTGAAGASALQRKVEWSKMSDEEIDAEMRSQIGAAVQEAVGLSTQQTLSEVESRYIAPTRAQQVARDGANRALADFAAENARSNEDIQTAVKAAHAYHADLARRVPGYRFDWNEKSAVAAIERFLPPKAAAPAPSNGSAAPGIPRVATTARGTGAIAPEPLPAHERGGPRAWNTMSFAEKLAKTRDYIREMGHPNTTEADVLAALRPNREELLR